MVRQLTDCRISGCRIVARIASSPGSSAPRTPREAPPARPPACFVVTIRFNAQSDAEPPGRGLAGW
eukprot:3341749-Alexandrium_andersonii.AAC.1